MSKPIFLGVILLSVCSPGVIAAEPVLHFASSGFSIAPLKVPPEAGGYQALIMFLPPSEAFAPNVNVQIQPFDGSLKAYAQLSRSQFSVANLTIINERFEPNAVIWEYSGKLQGQPLHWYAKAQAAEGKIYLATATATPTQWDSLSNQLKACIDSFTITDQRR